MSKMPWMSFYSSLKNSADLSKLLQLKTIDILEMEPQNSPPFIKSVTPLRVNSEKNRIEQKQEKSLKKTKLRCM